MVRSVGRRKYDDSPSRSRSTSRTSSSSSSSASSSSPSTSSTTSRSSSSSSSSSASSSRSKVSDKRRSPSPVTLLQISRLTKNVNKNHVLEIFKSYGPVKSVDLPYDRYHPHLSRGSAFVEFEKPDDAGKAIRFMDGGQIDGQEVSVARCYNNNNNNNNRGNAQSRNRGGSHRNGPWWRNASPPPRR